MALAPNALFRNDMTMLEPPQNRLSPSQIWPLENPVGTEQVRPQYLTAPDADVVPGVMWGDRMTSPRVAGGLNSAMEIGMGFAGSTGPGGIKAYHASPHSFEQFSTKHIGTGEGNQAFGHGLYASESPAISGGGGHYDMQFTAKNLGKHDLNQQETSILRGLREGKSELDLLREQAQMGASFDEAQAAIDRVKAAKAHIYEVNIAANPEHMLHWDKPLSEQSPYVQKAIEKLRIKSQSRPDEDPTGAALYHRMQEGAIGAQAMREAGIPGIRYLDQGSRGAGEGSHNLVVFDDATIEILRKYGLAGLMLGGGAAAGTQGQ